MAKKSKKRSKKTKSIQQAALEVHRLYQKEMSNRAARCDERIKKVLTEEHCELRSGCVMTENNIKFIWHSEPQPKPEQQTDLAKG